MTARREEKLIQLEDGYQLVLHEGIRPIINLLETGKQEFLKVDEFIKLYNVVFHMCIQREPYNWSEDMYDRYTQAIRDYLKTTVEPDLERARESFEMDFLRTWAKRWSNHKLFVRALWGPFMYLDRFYTLNTDGILPLKDQGYRLYKEMVFDKFCSTASTFILNAIQKERESEVQDRHLLSQAVQVFVEMGFNFQDSKLKLYQSELEKNLISHAGAYYKRKSRSWMDQDSCPSYLQKAEACLQNERNRVDSYLNPCTMDPLTRECYIQLLKEHQHELLNKSTGVNHLLELQRTDDLSRLYRLFSKYPEDLQPIADLFGSYIKKCGANVVDNRPKGAAGAAVAPSVASDSKEESKEQESKELASGSAEANHALVRALIDLHEQFANIVKICFLNHQIFQKALKSAFEDFINRDARVSKLLAKFVNDVLKKHSKISTTKEGVENILDHVVFLYGYISEKDIFERDYQLYLSHRLLMGLCESEHYEKSMIAKLKTECGYQWTNRLEGMFKDVQKSKDLMLKFQKVYDTEKVLGLSFFVNVCTTGYWPSSKMVPCRLPEDLQPACDKFKRFYLAQYSGHKLEWRMDQGQAEVQVFFSKTVKRGLICSTYQMMTLLAFNSSPKPLTCKTILELTGLPMDDIRDHLLSLCHPNVKVLLKNPNVNALTESDQFMLNPKFDSKLLKVQIPLYRKEKKDDEEAKAIEIQRNHQMDAAIVRIMKIRKQSKHNRLVAEVIQQLSARFKPNPALIKKRIEVLIESEYLKRDEQERSTYTYLA